MMAFEKYQNYWYNNSNNASFLIGSSECSIGAAIKKIKIIERTPQYIF